MITDMTVGKPSKVLLNFSLPLLFSTVFQQLYNIADSIIAGRFIGENALAAVGASYPITMIFMAIAFGSTQGSSVIISQLFGAKKITEMKTAVNTAYVSIGLLSALLTLVGVLLCQPMLDALDTPQTIIADSVSYMQVYSFGLFFLFMYNVATCVFSSLGDSKTPLLLLIGSSVGNVILDIVFVAYFKMGVSALALATLIAQGVAATIAVLVLFRRFRSIESEDKPKFFSGSMLKKISVVAIPSILQQSFVSVGNLFIQQIINSYDDSAIIAGYSAAIKLNTFAIVMFSSLSSGVANFTAQNLGAGKQDRVKKGYKSGMIMAEAVALIIVAIMLLFGRFLVTLFIEEPSETAMKTGIDFLTIVSPFYFFVCAKLISDSVLRGAGAMKCFMISTFTDLLLRVILAYMFSSMFGVVGIWWSWPIGWVIAAAVAVFFYARGYWKNQLKI